MCASIFFKESLKVLRRDDLQPEFVCLDGEMILAAEALVPALATGVLQGVGLFETVRVVSGVPIFLAAHLGRMRRSARFFGLRPSCPWADIARRTREVVKRNNVSSGVVRITMTARAQFPSRTRTAVASVLVAMRPIGATSIRPPEGGVRLISAPWAKAEDSPLSRHKTTSNFENVLARKYAEEKGAFDVVFCDSRGRILEGAISNIFVVLGNQIVTPSSRLAILPGITRAIVWRLCERARLPVREGLFHKNLLRRAAEIFVTNAVVGILPVTRFDGVKVGRGETGNVTKILMAAYDLTVQEEVRTFRSTASRK